MKITRVEPILVRTPLKLDDAQPHAGGLPKNDVHTVLVKVETDEGVTGWGEAFSNAGWQSTCTAIAQIIAPRVVGRDPSQIAQIQADLHRGLYNTGRSGPTVFAISGLDIALWDIAAKRASLPRHRARLRGEGANVAICGRARPLLAASCGEEALTDER